MEPIFDEDQVLRVNEVRLNPSLDLLLIDQEIKKLV